MPLTLLSPSEFYHRFCCQANTFFRYCGTKLAVLCSLHHHSWGKNWLISISGFPRTICSCNEGDWIQEIKNALFYCLSNPRTSVEKDLAVSRNIGTRPIQIFQNNIFLFQACFSTLHTHTTVQKHSSLMFTQDVSEKGKPVPFLSFRSSS